MKKISINIIINIKILLIVWCIWFIIDTLKEKCTNKGTKLYCILNIISILIRVYVIAIVCLFLSLNIILIFHLISEIFHSLILIFKMILKALF